MGIGAYASKQHNGPSPHLAAVSTAIPVHHLPARLRIATRVERIAPAHSAVNNGVHRHDPNELFFFTHGSGTHMMDLEQVAVRTPSLHVARA